MKLAFQLDRVTVAYPAAKALNGVSLRVRVGEQIALVGPSGSGKTTLLRLLNGTIRPSAGRVMVLGREAFRSSSSELRRLRSRIGFVHQNLCLVPNVLVLQNVLSGRMGRSSWWSSLRSMLLPSAVETREIHELLERVGVEEKLFQQTQRLSGGQQQRVAIARALYQEPEAILADEPVSSVDPARAWETVRLLTEISTEKGLTFCASLHNLELARQFFPRLIGMRRGRIVFDRSTSSLTDDEFQSLYHLEDDEILADDVEV